VITIELARHVDEQVMEEALADILRDWGYGSHGIVVNTLGMSTYEMGAQQVFIDWVNENTDRIFKVAIVSSNPMWHVISSAIAPAVKVPLRIFYSLEDAQLWVKAN
jgi:hypothetical protein